MNYDLKNYEDAKAKAVGKKIVIPKDNELMIDIDSEEQLLIFKDRIKELNELIHYVHSIKTIPSQGGSGHYHIYVLLDLHLTEIERAFLQLFLGSDPIREYLAYCLTKIGDPHPTLFFEDYNFDEDKREICGG